VVWNAFALRKTPDFMFRVNKPISFHHLPLSLFVNGFTSLLLVNGTYKSISHVNGMASKGHPWPPLAIICAFYKQRMVIASYRTWVISILKCTIVASDGSSKVTTLSNFPPFPFSICFLQLVGALKHNLFLCPFVTPLIFFTFDLDLGPFSLFLFSPYVGRFVL
jgi:hypothetical protein